MKCTVFSYLKNMNKEIIEITRINLRNEYNSSKFLELYKICVHQSALC